MLSLGCCSCRARRCCSSRCRSLTAVPALPARRRRPRRVHLQHVRRQRPVRVRVGPVEDQPHQVEAGEQGRGQGDVLGGRPADVVAAPGGVGRRQERRAGVERGGDAGFRDGHRLLLHDLVDGGSVGLFVVCLEFFFGRENECGEKKEKV